MQLDLGRKAGPIMDLKNLTLFQVAQQRMDWLAQRQKVVSQNLANANTPGYKGRDLKKVNFRDTLSLALAKETQPAQVTRTNPKHLVGHLPKTGPYRSQAERRPYEFTLDKNGVDIDEQMQKAANNRTQYTLASNLVSKNLKMIRMALGHNN